MILVELSATSFYVIIYLSTDRGYTTFFAGLIFLAFFAYTVQQICFHFFAQMLFIIGLLGAEVVLFVYFLHICTYIICMCLFGELH